MKKFILLILLNCILIVHFSSCKKDTSYSNFFYDKLCGYYIQKDITEEDEFIVTSILDKRFNYFEAMKKDWGYTYFEPSSSEIEINIVRNNSTIKNKFIGISKITKIKKIDKDNFELIIEPGDFMQKEKDYYNLKINFIKEDYIKIIGDLSCYNGEFLRIGGPKIKFNDYYKPKINNLKMRSKKNLNEVIKILTLKDRIAITKISYYSFTKENENFYNTIEEQTVNGIKGYWVEIQTEDGEEGICFSGYLKQDIN